MFFERRTCQTGLLRPTWTPGRPGLLGHFLDFDSPAELLREHGALFTFRFDGAPANNLGRVQALPADLLREKGHMLMFNSAELVPLPFPLFFSFFFPLSFSLSSVLFDSAFFLSLFLKMSFHRFEEVKVDADSIMDGDGVGSGSCIGGSTFRVWFEVSDLLVVGRRWRGRRTPSTNNSSAE